MKEPRPRYINGVQSSPPSPLLIGIVTFLLGPSEAFSPAFSDKVPATGKCMQIFNFLGALDRAAMKTFESALCRRSVLLIVKLLSGVSISNVSVSSANDALILYA